jgi:hypothetical protein
MREWDRSHYSAYGYGWRLTDVDGTWKVSHTGTLGGMYSALTLLPEKNVGFVIMINGDADDARTVLTQVLVKHFTVPQSNPGVADYAARLEVEQQQAAAAKPVPDTSDRVPATAADLAGNAGVYRDPCSAKFRSARKARASRSPPPNRRRCPARSCVRARACWCNGTARMRRSSPGWSSPPSSATRPQQCAWPRSIRMRISAVITKTWRSRGFATARNGRCPVPQKHSCMWERPWPRMLLRPINR